MAGSPQARARGEDKLGERARCGGGSPAEDGCVGIGRAILGLPGAPAGERLWGTAPAARVPVGCKGGSGKRELAERVGETFHLAKFLPRRSPERWSLPLHAEREGDSALRQEPRGRHEELAKFRAEDLGRGDGIADWSTHPWVPQALAARCRWMRRFRRRASLVYVGLHGGCSNANGCS